MLHVLNDVEFYFWVLVGMVYAYGGLYVLLHVTSKYKALDQWIGDSFARGNVLLVLWLVLLPLLMIWLSTRQWRKQLRPGRFS